MSVVDGWVIVTSYCYLAIAIVAFVIPLHVTVLHHNRCYPVHVEGDKTLYGVYIVYHTACPLETISLILLMTC